MPLRNSVSVEKAVSEQALTRLLRPGAAGACDECSIYKPLFVWTSRDWKLWYNAPRRSDRAEQIGLTTCTQLLFQVPTAPMKLTYVKALIPERCKPPLRHVRDTVRRRSSALGGYLRGRIIIRRMQSAREEQIREYLATSRVSKLQLGAGMNALPGWLNSEGFEPSSFITPRPIPKGYVYLDAREHFPFDDNCLDYVFHEHMIEHLDYPQGLEMLKECFRVLKPGGKIRIAAPDLETFVGLYGADRSEEQVRFLSEYVRLNSEVWCSDLRHVEKNHAVFVLNHGFRAWGHLFIYDFATLADAMTKAGFVNISRQRPQESPDPHLRGLEMRKEIVGVFDALIAEGEKPSVDRPHRTPASAS